MNSESEKLIFLVDSLKKSINKLEEYSKTKNISDFPKMKETVIKIQEDIGREINELSKD